ncbi:serpin family protein [Fibrella sp. WM1]|uniref:serpin family protein n=1 Tax=Fibrella musci TaxID=3242485 RepID=UPI00352272B8
MRSLLITVSVGIALVVAGCGRNNGAVTPDETRPLRIAAPFVSQTTDFAFDAFRRINEQAAGDNVFYSPLSLHMALGMVLNGANGSTKTELQKVLRLDGQTLTDANQTYATLRQDLPAVDTQVKLQLANSVWYRNGFTVAPTFETVLRDTFNAQSAGLDFDSPAALAAINGWANSNTNGLISKVVDQIAPNEVLYLLNAIYFKGNWKTQFDPARTIDAPFTLTNGTTKSVRMMRLDAELRRAFRETYTAFELPYGGGQTAMTVLLPKNGTTADGLLGTFTPAEWTQLQTAMSSGKIDIGLPKFTLKTENKLQPVLSQMGMPTAFTDRADFTGINPNGGLLLTSVKQNAFVAVDEKGTEAAAVTTIGVGVTSAPVPYICDRPFVFVIHEKGSGAILFMGKISNPTTQP